MIVHVMLEIYVYMIYVYIYILLLYTHLVRFRDDKSWLLCLFGELQLKDLSTANRTTKTDVWPLGTLWFAAILWGTEKTTRLDCEAGFSVPPAMFLCRGGRSTGESVRTLGTKFETEVPYSPEWFKSQPGFGVILILIRITFFTNHGYHPPFVQFGLPIHCAP